MGRRPLTEKSEGGDTARKHDFVDRNLSPQANAAGQAARMCLVDDDRDRCLSVFLGRDDYTKVEYTKPQVIAELVSECLTRFVHANGGRVVFATDFEERYPHPINCTHGVVVIGGQTRYVLKKGFLFCHFKNERAVCGITSDSATTSRLVVASNVDSSAFWSRWEAFCRQDNYLRRQAFFVEGEIITRKKRFAWDDILLPEHVKDTIRRNVEGFFEHRGRLQGLGVKSRRGLLLAGLPGTGKTLIGKILADTLDVSFLWVSPRHVKDGSSFEHILDLARFLAPTIVFMEDIDLFAEEREMRGGMALGELMNQLDGASENQDVVAIATTNRLDVVETALRNRPGRFDRVIEFGPMDEVCRRRMLGKLLAKGQIGDDDLQRLVRASDGYTGAQIEELVNTLYILAVDGGNGSNSEDNADCVRVSGELIAAALNEVRVERKAQLGFNAA